MNRKCKICEQREALWAWQPFGPDATPNCFELLGSHYRGFPVVAVCVACKEAFQHGTTLVFRAAGKRHVAFAGRVYPANTFEDALWLARVVSDHMRDAWLERDNPNWHGGVEAAKEIERELALIRAAIPSKVESAAR